MLRPGIALALCCLLAAAQPLVAQTAGAPAPGRADAPLIVVTDINYPPYLFLDARGEVKGILKDKWDLWAERNGTPVTVRGMEWTKAQQAVLDGQADVLEAVTYRADRGQFYEFSLPYAFIEAHVYFHRSISGINDAASLRGFKVGVKAGSACGNWLYERGVDDLRNYPTSEALVKAADSDDIRVFCMDAPAAQYFLYKQDLAQDFRRTPALYEGNFHWAVKKGRTELRDRLQLGLEKISADEMRAIEERWLGNPLSFPIGGRYLAIAGGAAAALLAAGALLLLWNRALRTRVAEHTAELRNSEERFRSITEFHAAYAWELDDQLRFTWITGRKLADYGLVPDQLIGRRYSELDVNFEFTSVTTEEFAHLRRQGLPYRDVRGAFTHVDGTVRHVSLWGVPLRTADGRFTGYRGLSLDITERVQLERALEQLNETLEQRVALRTAELAEANRELEAFAYSVSHDLRGPLRSIDRFAQMAISGSEGRVDEGVTQALQRVRASSQRMGQLINDLLALSQVTRAELRREPVDVSALAAEILAELRAGEPERRVTAAVQPGMAAQADRNLLRIALENLLRNAWKFTGRVDEARIEVGTEPLSNGGAAFLVRDNGAGFDMQYAAKLFHAFERLHGEAEFPGTGIGLAIVDRIVARHGGRVWAESAPGAGAVFRFTLGADA